MLRAARAAPAAPAATFADGTGATRSLPAVAAPNGRSALRRPLCSGRDRLRRP
jgi:hypothetical protein